MYACIAGWPLTWRTWKTGKSQEVVREKSGGKRKSQGKCVLAYDQLLWVLILTQNVQKANYLLGKVVQHMKSERRKDAYSARCKLCLKTFLLSNMFKQAVVSHAKSSGHVWKSQGIWSWLESGHPVLLYGLRGSKYTILLLNLIVTSSILLHICVDCL